MITRYGSVYDLVKRNAVVALILAVSCALYFYPYVANHSYIVASTHSDDDFIVCNIVYNNIENFKNDMYFYLAPVFMRGTMMNWGSLFLANKIGIPVTFLSLAFQFIEFFMLPFCYLFTVRNAVEKVWLPLVFLTALLSHHFTWNLSNHGMPDLPYRANIAVSMLFAGQMLIIRGRRQGYVLAIFGILFHVAIGVYGFVTIAIWQMLQNRKLLSRDTMYLIPLIVAIIVPAYSILSLEHLPVSKQDLLDLYRFSMHFYPWDSPFRWEQSVPAVCALFLLTLFTRPYWGGLGDSYRSMVQASVVSTALFMVSHMAGVALGIPSLISICGLHAPTLLAVFILPVFLVASFHILTQGSVVEKFFVLFTIATIIVGRPYGLYVYTTFMMLLYSNRGRCQRTDGLLEAVVVVLTLMWFALWSITSMPPGLLLARHMIDVLPDALLKFVLPLVVDAAPSLTRVPIVVTGLALFLACVCLAQTTFRIRPAKVYPLLLTIIACAFLVVNAKQTYARTGSQDARDLYAAQVWAREHSQKTAKFIVPGGSWRAYSERSAFVPQYFGYYLYLPDSRLKAFDDTVFRFFGIDNPYRVYDQRSLQNITRERYMSLEESDFYRLAAIADAQYLVETRQLNLPLAYRNATYYIYRLM